MKDAYLYRFREAGRIYQIILIVDEERRLSVIDSKIERNRF